MRLRVKTLAGAVHIVEVSETDDIATLRERVATAAGFEREGLRLLHAGELLVAGPIRHTRLLDGDFIVAVVAKQAKLKTPVPSPDVKMTDAPPLKKEQRDNNSSDSDAAPKQIPPVASSPEPPPHVDGPIPNELRAQLQELMVGLLDLAGGGGRQHAVHPPPPAAQVPAEIVVDPALIQQLVDMGFAQNRARKALILSRLNLQRAMEWLLEHENDPDVDAPLPPNGVPVPKQPAGGAENDAQAVQRLQEMGFSAEDVQQALRATNNNYEAACAWLLGDRDGAAAAAAAGEDQGEEEEEEVDESNPMIAAILNNPQIQSSLTPRVVQAFQAMMDNPGASVDYVNDPEVGPVLMQVLQIVRGGNAAAANPNNNGANNAANNLAAAAAAAAAANPNSDAAASPLVPPAAAPKSPLPKDPNSSGSV